jgi:hypothetical protein
MYSAFSADNPKTQWKTQNFQKPAIWR